MNSYHDLTHAFTDNMPVYPGDEAPLVRQIARLADEGFNEYCYQGGFHVGTHMDAPLHMLDQGNRISDISIDRYFGRGRLIDARGRASISADLLDSVAIEPGDIVVVLTGWYKRFNESNYYADFPPVDVPFAEKLVEMGASILALDTPSPDHAPFPVHKILLGAGVLIVENLAEVECLLGVSYFDVVALPAKFEWEGAPVRVVAAIDQSP